MFVHRAFAGGEARPHGVRQFAAIFEAQAPPRQRRGRGRSGCVDVVDAVGGAGEDGRVFSDRQRRGRAVSMDEERAGRTVVGRGSGNARTTTAISAESCAPIAMPPATASST